MNYIKLNGTSFDVNVAISKYNEYIGHKITVFRRGDDYQSYDAFWSYLKAHSVDDSVLLEAADGNTTISYRAYYTSASHDIEKVENGVNYWGEIEIHFIPIAPQITP